jgi:zinc transport system permease protein
MMDTLLLPFVQRALVAVALAAPLLGLLSPLVLARRLAFFSAAIGQAVLTGVALGVLLGEPVEAPWASVFGFSLLCGVGLVFVRRRSALPPDTLVGVLLAVTLGLGVLLLTVVTKRFNVHQLEAVMFGSVLTTTPFDLGLLRWWWSSSSSCAFTTRWCSTRSTPGSPRREGSPQRTSSTASSCS